jgi:hypothetical protein
MPAGILTRPRPNHIAKILFMKNAALFLLIGISVIARGQNTNIPVSQLPALTHDSVLAADFYPVVHHGHYYKLSIGTADSLLNAHNGLSKHLDSVTLGGSLDNTQTIVSLNQNNQALVLGDTGNGTILGIGDLVPMGGQAGSILVNAHDLISQGDSMTFLSNGFTQITTNAQSGAYLDILAYDASNKTAGELTFLDLDSVGWQHVNLRSTNVNSGFTYGIEAGAFRHMINFYINDGRSGNDIARWEQIDTAVEYFIRSLGPVLIIDTLGNMSQNKSRFVPSNGNTISLTRPINLIKPSSSLSTLTIQLPIAQHDGQMLEMSFTQTIGTLTWSGAALDSNVPNSVIAGNTIRLFYDVTDNKWYNW